MALGLGKTLAELEHIDADELAGWLAFWELEPWGCPAADHRAELGLNLLYAINSTPGSTIPRFIDRDPQKNSKPDPTPEELEESIRDFFIGKTVKAEPAPVKQRKPRKDKGVKRGPRQKPSKRNGFGTGLVKNSKKKPPAK